MSVVALAALLATFVSLSLPVLDRATNRRFQALFAARMARTSFTPHVRLDQSGFIRTNEDIVLRLHGAEADYLRGRCVRFLRRDVLEHVDACRRGAAGCRDVCPDRGRLGRGHPVALRTARLAHRERHGMGGRRARRAPPGGARREAVGVRSVGG
jgi:hypothetical protein